MTNPFANIPTKGGSYLKFDMPGQSYTGIIAGTRVGRNFDETADVPEILLTIDGEEKVLACENAALHNWAVNNGAAVAASVGQPLTVTFTGKSGQVKLYDVTIGGAPAPQPAVAAVPAAAPSAAPQAAPVAAVPQAAPVAAPVSPDAVA